MNVFEETESGFCMHEQCAENYFGFIPVRGDVVRFDGHDYRTEGFELQMIVFTALETT